MQFKTKPLDKVMKHKHKDEEIEIKYTCEPCEIDYTSMEKVDDNNDKIEEEYLEPDLSYKCKMFGKDFIKILESIQQALNDHEAQRYIENMWKRMRK